VSTVRGFTLLEILVASALMVTALTCATLVFTHLTRSSSSETREQEYYSLMAQLEARVKHDLRSSEGVKQEAEGVYSLIVINLDAQGSPQTKTIVYWVDESGLGVTRHVHETGERNIYNFASLMEEGKNFVFRLTP
jgi:prepilin-type N-terminal cleavage/methylation domain-containing protein